jgi:hypothetical protein
LEKEPLKKQLIDKLFIEGSGQEILSAYREKKIIEFKFSPNKMIIEPKDNLEILPIEREPLKKQLVDNLYIEGLFLMKPENKIQNIDKLTILSSPKKLNNIVSPNDSIESIVCTLSFLSLSDTSSSLSEGPITEDAILDMVSNVLPRSTSLSLSKKLSAIFIYCFYFIV